jgi:hypothetical protein
MLMSCPQGGEDVSDGEPVSPPAITGLALEQLAGDITLSGGTVMNTISQRGANSRPTGITLSAEGYENPRWYVNGGAPGSAGSITRNAGTYEVRRHSVSFTGTKNGILYAKEIPFTVVE